MNKIDYFKHFEESFAETPKIKQGQSQKCWTNT